jgi:putative aminopeptidase FrvX
MQPSSLEYLKALIDAPSPSGKEGPVAHLYRSYVADVADRITTDIQGNVTAILNPDAPMRIMLSDHMDEIGFIIHHIDADGLLYFSAVGGHDSTTPIGQMVWVHGRERVAGAVGRKAIHLMSPAELGRKPDLSDLWIDIGASSKAEAESVVQLGDYVTYQHEFRTLLGDRATGRAFDNKAGLFIVSEALRLLKEEGGLAPGVGVYALGTVQEEIGSRGATTAASRIDPTTGLAVDMEQALDYPGISATKYGEAFVGKGPTLSKGPNTNPIVFDLLTKAAATESIPLQVLVAPSTTPTDEKAMQVNNGGMATGLVGVPLRYMHTPCEVLSLSDLERCARLVAGYCRLVTATTDFTPF